MEKENMEELMRRLCATAAAALREAASDGNNVDRMIQNAWDAEQFARLAKGAAPMDTKELEHVATFN